MCPHPLGLEEAVWVGVRGEGEVRAIYYLQHEMQHEGRPSCTKKSRSHLPEGPTAEQPPCLTCHAARSRSRVAQRRDRNPWSPDVAMGETE